MTTPPPTPEDFNRLFDGWLAEAARTGGPRQRSSEAVYRSIWSSFAQWCLAQSPSVELLQVTTRQLHDFLGTRQGTVDPSGDLSDRHAWTVLNLIDRVSRHAARVLKAEINTSAADLIAARPSIRYANAAGSPLPDHLAADEARALVLFLSHIRPRSRPRSRTVPAGSPAPEVSGSRPWHDLRNHASVALQLGAGLTPGDVRAMKVAGVVVAGGPLRDVPWKLRVPADGNTPARETPVAPWAGQLLRHWLAVRADHAIAGDWLFPSTKSGKPWSKIAQYRSAGHVLAAAGIAVTDGGSFRLRHTFALRQLRRGKSPADVARWMGIARLETLERYRRVLHPAFDAV